MRTVGGMLLIVPALVGVVVRVADLNLFDVSLHGVGLIAEVQIVLVLLVLGALVAWALRSPLQAAAAWRAHATLATWCGCSPS